MDKNLIKRNMNLSFKYTKSNFINESKINFMNQIKKYTSSIIVIFLKYIIVKNF